MPAATRSTLSFLSPAWPRGKSSPTATGAAAEQYRLLAQRLEPMLARGGRRIGFTSASSGEGRTTTAVNTAFALARGHRNRVVLVDCDLRAPACT